MQESLRPKILKAIEDQWPAHTKELAQALGLEPNNSNIKKVSYHMQQLEKQGKIRTKRIGLALTAWPTEMEKLRIIHEMMRED